MTDTRESEYDELKTESDKNIKEIANSRKYTDNTFASILGNNNVLKEEGANTSDYLDFDRNNLNNKASKSTQDLKDSLRVIVKQSLELKRLGNECFSKQSYSNSIEYFKKSLSGLELSNEYEQILSLTNINNIKIECYNNLAICFMVKTEYSKVLEYTDYALNLQKKNYKALYIKSRALKKLNRWENALDVVKQVRLYYNIYNIGA